MLLAIDSASQWMSLALYDGQQVLAEQLQRSQNQHTVQLSAQLQRLLQEQGLTPSDLKALAIAQGVGSYSGLRVGFGVAKGLALALQLPLIPIPTLAITALGTPFFEGNLMAVVSAGRHRILAQAYHWSGDAWQASNDPANTTWEALIASLSGPTLVNGEIDPAGQALLTQAGLSLLPPAYRVRRAGFLAQAAWERFVAHDYPVHSAQVMPLYVNTP
jgi:tRNA threonylcarbamoyladenosine biosynthesis protein TsaB